MATEIVMPKWGLTMKEGKISRWFKSEGEKVSKGEALFEVETSKITNVVESPVDGVLFQILVPEGETVAVQTVVAVVAEPGEKPVRREGPPESRGEEVGQRVPGGTAGGAQDKKKFVPASPIARRLAKEWGIDLARITGSGPGGRVTEEDVRRFKEDGAPTINASPKALALAEKMGIDLADVKGSGPDGRILKVDVLRAANPHYRAVAGGEAGVSDGEPQAAQAVPEKRSLPPGAIPMSGMRKVIADNMMASLHQSAQLTVFVEADITATREFRDKLREKFSGTDGSRMSYNNIIAFAACRALKKHPLMNSHLIGEEILIHDKINLGIAVALDDGLIVPNIKDAGGKSLFDLSTAIRQAVVKARKNQLTMDEIQGGTFTISNVSGLGVDGFTPILNPPETAILGVGRAVEKPAVVAGEIRIRTMMVLSLTFDHRVVDGAPAMRFLRTLADLLEAPVMMLA